MHRQAANDQTFASDWDMLHSLLRTILSLEQSFLMTKVLMDRFGSLQKICLADPEHLSSTPHLAPEAVVLLKTIHALALKMGHDEIYKAPLLKDGPQLVRYCRLRLTTPHLEHVLVFYLSSDFELIRDEVHQRGTHNMAALYPREILKNALNAGAEKIIVAHNHPGRDKAVPSADDIALTRNLERAAASVDIGLEDHLIFTDRSFYSFRTSGLLG